MRSPRYASSAMQSVPPCCWSRRSSGGPIIGHQLGIDLTAQFGEQPANILVDSIELRELLDQARRARLKRLLDLGELCGAFRQRAVCIMVEAFDGRGELVANLVQRIDEALDAILLVFER